MDGTIFEIFCGLIFEIRPLRAFSFLSFLLDIPFFLKKKRTPEQPTPGGPEEKSGKFSFS